MALYVIPVPDPPVGADWTYTVPGQYIEHITGITATLTPGAVNNFPTCSDVSGNGNDATYSNGGSTFVAGLVPGNGALQRNAGNGDQINGTHAIVDVSSAFTYLEWVQFDAVGPNDIQLGAYADSVVHHVGWDLVIPAGFPHRFFVQGSRNMAGNVAQWETVNNVVPYDSAPHLIAVTFDPAATPQNTFYLDGVVIPWQFNDLPLVFNGPSAGWHFNIGYSPKITDELAIVPGVLSSAQIAALHAAGSSFATYSPAVLGLSPFVYYHLDGLGAPGGGHQVILETTDGTHDVLEVPAGFPTATGTGPYSYSWQPNLNSSSQTPDGSVTTVAIPDLILPAGYTVGSRTLDLAAGDQWSDIFIWWDSAYMDALDPLNAYVFPGGIRLVYQQERP